MVVSCDFEWDLPSAKLIYLLKMAIYIEFSHHWEVLRRCFGGVQDTKWVPSGVIKDGWKMFELNRGLVR